MNNQNKNYKPISPLQSPNSGSMHSNNSNSKYNTYNTQAGSVTPPYYSGMAKDLQRPIVKDNYHDEPYADDFYKSSSSTLDLPRKNSNSPAPTSPVSYR